MGNCSWVRSGCGVVALGAALAGPAPGRAIDPIGDPPPAAGAAEDDAVELPLVEIVEEADLAVELIDQVDPIVAGGVQIYHLRVTNRGPGRATGVALQHELPGGAVFLGVEPAAIGCEPFSGVLVDCDLGMLEPGASIDLRIGALIDSRIDGAVSSEALVAANEPDPDGSNDQVEVDTAVVPARAMIATTRAGAPALAAVVKEGTTSVGIVLADPAGGGERESSVEAAGFRAVSMTEAPSFGGTASPEVAVLAAGFGGETRVVVIDAGSRALLGDHEVAGDWLARGIVAVESFAGTAAAELALLLGARDGSELRLRVIDASTGIVARDHLLAIATVGAAGAGVAAPVPIGMVAVPSFDGAPRPELAILTRSPGSGEVRVRVVDADSGSVLGDHDQGTGLFPLGIVGLESRSPRSGTSTAEIAILVRRAGSGDLQALVLDAPSGAVVGSVDFDRALSPGGFAAVRALAASPAGALAVVGRVAPDILRVSVRDAATGAAVSSITLSTAPGAPVPLGLVSLPGFGGGSTPALAVLFELFGEPTQVQVFDALGAGPEVAFSLP